MPRIRVKIRSCENKQLKTWLCESLLYCPLYNYAAVCYLVYYNGVRFVFTRSPDQLFTPQPNVRLSLNSDLAL